MYRREAWCYILGTRDSGEGNEAEKTDFVSEGICERDKEGREDNVYRRWSRLRKIENDHKVIESKKTSLNSFYANENLGGV